MIWRLSLSLVPGSPRLVRANVGSHLRLILGAEVTNLTARYLMTMRRFGVAAIGAAMAAPVLVGAQANAVKGPEKGAVYVMVTAFKSADKGPKSIGGEAADEMRDRMEHDFPARQMWVIPKERINPNLEASGFSTTEALAVHDAKALASMLRADEYIAGSVVKTGTGYKVDGELVLTKDITARQPLGAVEAPKLGDAIKGLSAELKEARKQLEGEQKCTNFARAKQYSEAIAAAKAAIVAYPKSTLARICELSVLDASGAKPEEVLAVAREINAIDPRNSLALKQQVAQFQKLKMDDSVGVTLVKLLSTDPTNSTLAAQVIATLLDMKNLDFAAPLVDTAIANNPGDPDLLKFKWTILYATKKFKDMYPLGEEIAKLDTSFTDSVYFARTAQAYATDSLPQKSAEVAARALAKFPGNPFFTGFEIQQLQKAGQQQQALDKLDKALAAKVPVENAGTMRLLMLRDLKRGPDVMPAIRTLIAAGDTSANVKQILFAQAGDDKNVALAAATTVADSVAAFRANLAIFAYADSNIAPKNPMHAESQFRLGAAHLSLVQPLLKQALAEKNCTLAKEAKSEISESQILLPTGGAYDPKTTAQLMGALTQLDGYASQVTAGMKCK
jgi:tetratricopeptide (TPR) repeat protein